MLDAEDKQWIGDMLDELENRLIERMRGMQTELLKAFHPFQESK